MKIQAFLKTWFKEQFVRFNLRWAFLKHLTKISKQENEKDCGLSVLKYFIEKLTKQNVTIKDLRLEVNFSERGISLERLSELGKKHGLILNSFQVKSKDLFESGIKNEFIALINIEGYNHYVVAGVDNQGFAIKDSVKGNYDMTFEEFDQKFLQVVSLVEVDENFKAEKRQEKTRVIERPIVNQMLKNKAYLFAIGTLSILLSVLLMFLSTIFMKVILDKVLPYQLKDTLILVVVAFVLIALIRSFNHLSKNIVTKKIQKIYEFELLTLYQNKLRDLPNDFLRKFTQNDLLRRWGYIRNISDMFANGFFVIINEIFIFLASMALMVFVSSESFIIVLCFGVLMVLNMLIFYFYSNKKAAINLDKQLVNVTNVYDYVKNVFLIKNPLLNKKLSNQINTSYQELTNSEMKLFVAGTWSKMIGESLNFIIPIITTLINSLLIFGNRISIGQMLMLTSASTFFLSSLQDLIGFSLSYIVFKRELKLFEELVGHANEESNPLGINLENIQSLELQNLSFGYDQNVFNVDHLKIDSSLILKGKNGCGKSSLLKVLGALEKANGKYLINDIEIEFYSLESLRENFIYVSSEAHLPKMKVIDYICDNDESKNTFETNLQNIFLKKIINDSGININHEIINGGENFSSGQRQIIQLLRIFADRPKLLLLDEAFENVDLANFEMFRKLFENYEGLILEVSHSKKYVRKSKEVNFEIYQSK